jgi:5'-nucleotidase
MIHFSPLPPQLPLRIGISTRALFQLEEEHAIFESDGVAAYAEIQRQREGESPKPGTGFQVVRRLLSLNKIAEKNLVEVIFLSRNSPDLSLRAFLSASEHELDIRRGSFTSGRPLAPYAKAWGVDLFLSNHDEDVARTSAAGISAAKLCAPPVVQCGLDDEDVVFAFDGDSVIFGSSSDQIYKSGGLEKFREHEIKHAETPIEPGPLGKFLDKLLLIREQTRRLDGRSRVRFGVVTARDAPAHARAIQTLRAWNASADEAHFVGNYEKGPILQAMGAHIFFDDQEKHVLGAAAMVPAGLVPGPHDPSVLIIPAGE